MVYKTEYLVFIFGEYTSFCFNIFPFFFQFLNNYMEVYRLMFHFIFQVCSIVQVSW